MDIFNQFQVRVPSDLVWALFSDLERFAPMMPGVTLEDADEEEYRGTMKVKVGPVTVQYKGTARIVERDEAAGRLKIQADGQGAPGQGDAHAIFDATVKPTDGGTEVSVTTDLTVTGRVAQFGRGVMSDVAEKLIGQVAIEIERTLTGPAEPAAEPTANSRTGGNVIDLLGLARSTQAARIAAPVLLAAAGGAFWLWRARRCPGLRAPAGRPGEHGGVR